MGRNSTAEIFWTARIWGDWNNLDAFDPAKNSNLMLFITKLLKSLGIDTSFLDSLSGNGKTTPNSAPGPGDKTVGGPDDNGPKCRSGTCNGPSNDNGPSTDTNNSTSGPSNTNYPGDIPANVRSWVDQAAEELEKQGTHMSDKDKINMAIIAMHESGGDPNAVNNWDENAREGHPSIGLVQTIQSTFDAYSLPGHGDIHNPVDNIIAGYRYAESTYGSTDNVPGVKSLASGGAYVGY